MTVYDTLLNISLHLRLRVRGTLIFSWRLGLDSLMNIGELRVVLEVFGNGRAFNRRTDSEALYADIQKLYLVSGVFSSFQHYLPRL